MKYGSVLLAILVGLSCPVWAEEDSDGQERMEELRREVEAGLSGADLLDSEGISPQAIKEVQDLLTLDYPDTDEGASLKAEVYIGLARLYGRQEISQMAIKLLQDGVADVTGHTDAEIALRWELVKVYRQLGFAPQAIREYKRIRRLNSRSMES